jgi:hypothetical protein
MDTMALSTLEKILSRLRHHKKHLIPWIKPLARARVLIVTGKA